MFSRKPREAVATTVSSQDRPDLKLERDRKRVYWTYFSLCMSGFVALYAAVEVGLYLLSRKHFQFTSVSGLFSFAAATSATVATKVCHKRGLSEAKVRDEYVTHDRERPVRSRVAPLDIRNPLTAMCWVLAGMLGAMAAAFFWLAHHITDTGGILVGNIAGAAFGAGALISAVFALRRSSQRIVLVDETCLHLPRGQGKRKRLPWAEIETCRLRRNYDVFGRYATLEIAVFSTNDPAAQKKPMLSLTLPTLTPASRERAETIADAIRLALNPRAAEAIRLAREESEIAGADAAKMPDVPAGEMRTYRAAEADRAEDILRVQAR